MSRPSAAPSPSETAVAIAGAGPTGLALGLALAVRGVPCLLLEAEPGPGRESSRATTLHAGTLELLDLVEGLGSRIAARGVAARRSRILRAGRVVLEQDWTRVPSRYAQMLNLPQTEIEDALRTAFEERGGTIRWGAAVSAFAPDAAGVRIAAAGGALRARYLVGCDGARSAVRRGLGLALEGETYPDTFALADAEVKGDFAPWSSYPGASESGLLGLLPLPGGRWRLNATVPAEADAQPAGVLLAIRGLMGVLPAAALACGARWLGGFGLAGESGSSVARGV